MTTTLVSRYHLNKEKSSLLIGKTLDLTVDYMYLIFSCPLLEGLVKVFSEVISEEKHQ